MNLTRSVAIRLSFLFITGSLYANNTSPVKKQISIVLPLHAHVREEYGATKLVQALHNIGYTTIIRHTNQVTTTEQNILIGRLTDTLLVKRVVAASPGKEGFVIQSQDHHTIIIGGADYSGALYGCLELAQRINTAGQLPDSIHVTDHPEMVLRGTCIGMQKTTYLPGRGVYEYPYTPETFPWFYDKALWIRYLDMLVENRMNSLYLWNGHPFASLVRLKDYPYAVEVSDSTFKKNEEMFRFLTQEADKRGIWVIQMFYNIIVSKPFAEKNHMKTQDRERPIIPIIADYTRKSIAAFVEKYPNVGLMVTLGEAMEGVGQDDIDWFTKTIIPGVKDGLRALGQTEEPPLVLRAHDTDAPSVMEAALPLYKNLYTEAKYNGEALTTYEPRGSWAELHRTLSHIGTVQIENVHIMANLEPFRYGAADFIRKCVLAMHNIYEANGLHLYPQASFWDWPYTADSASPRLLQLDRDWIWYKEWSRYAWNAHRDEDDEVRYWSKLLGDKYGCNTVAGDNILEAYNQSGEIAPKLLRRFGITDGNRQTLTLGMLMTQLVNPWRFGLFTLLYDSESPEGEMLTQYAEKEWKHLPHKGETPVQIIEEVKAHGQKAVAAIDKAAPSVTKDTAEFNRLRNDMYAYNALANHYAEKAQAALDALRYKYSNDLNDLKKALVHLQKSVDYYKQLVTLTKDTYLYANSMQTQQRKIPVRGVNGTYKTWLEMLPVYQQEAAVFAKHIDSLEKMVTTPAKPIAAAAPLSNATVQLAEHSPGLYTMQDGATVFTDTAFTIHAFAKELARLQGVQLSFQQQVKNGTSITFTNTQPVKVLVGFFNQKSSSFLKEPELETNASANVYGQAETKIANGIVINGMPSINIHTYSFKAGTNTLVLAKGACLVLGFVNEDQPIRVYDAGLNDPSNKNIDWLFEN